MIIIIYIIEVKILNLIIKLDLIIIIKSKTMVKVI